MARMGLTQIRLLASATFVLCLFVYTPASVAQEADSFGNEFGLHMGSYLPNQIPGVTEILPFWGARYGISLGGKGAVEIGGMNAHALGVDFTTASLSLRGDLEAIESFTTIFYAGADVNWWRPLGETKRKIVGGGHFGSGLMLLVTDQLWFRTEMKFNINPGVGLYIGFGLQLRPGGGTP